MKENQLRIDVLIPLFKAMGFRDVDHFHGGALEQGKDIVMWKEGDLGERINYAVVAKRGDITGQASGSGSAAEVATQVQQCFGGAFVDPVSSEEQHVDRCWIVTSGRIPKEARQTLKNVLQPSRQMSNTSLIDGNRLWELVEKYLPEKTVFQLFAQANKILGQVAQGYDVAVQVEGQRTSIQLKRQQGTSATDFTLRPAADLPEEVKTQIQRKLEQLHATGSPLHLDGNILSQLVLPAPLNTLLSSEDKLVEIRQIIGVPGQLKTLRLDRICDDGETASLGGLQFTCVYGGTQEITLTNQEADCPWKFQLILNLPQAKANIKYDVQLEGANVLDVVRWLQFQRACAKAGSLSFVDEKTGIVYPSIFGGAFAEPISSDFLDYCERLSFIQSKSRNILKFKFDVSEEEEIMVDRAYNILKTGLGPNVEQFTFTFDAPLTTKMVESLSSKFSLCAPLGLGEITVIGVPIALGPHGLCCNQVQLTESSAQLLKKPESWGDVIQLSFEQAYPDDPIKMVYLAWLQEEDRSKHATLYKQFVAPSKLAT